MNPGLDFLDTVVALWHGWKQVLERTIDTLLDPLPPPKVFKPKHDLPKLVSYAQPAPEWFRCQFPKNLTSPGISRINHLHLEELALQNNFKDKKLLSKIITGIVHGEDIGCMDPYREKSWSTNAPPSLKLGEQVTDAIADWIQMGFAYSPVDITEAPPNIKVNGIMCKEKPNGSVRIILILGAPLGQAVNEGIDKKESQLLCHPQPSGCES